MSLNLPHLPPELILYTITHLIPYPHPIALPAHHPITKTLLSLTQTSHLTSSLAQRYLYTHCIYIDSFHRLYLLHRSLISREELLHSKSKQELGSSKSKAQELEEDGGKEIKIQSIYLSPFQSDRVTSFFQIEPIVAFLSEKSVFENVKRLVVRMPIRNIQTEEYVERKIARILFGALATCKQMEVFVSVLDDVDLLVIGGDYLPTLWPRLRILALYNTDLSNIHFALPKLSHTLQRMILTRPDGPRDNPEPSSPTNKNEKQTQVPKVEIVLVDIEGQQRRVTGWPSNGLAQGDGIEKVVRFRRLDIPIPATFNREEDSIDLAQDWVEMRFLEGDERFE